MDHQSVVIRATSLDKALYFQARDIYVLRLYLKQIICRENIDTAKDNHMTQQKILVGIIMGSQSDWETMQHAAETLDKLGVSHEVEIVSAHRTPDKLFSYAETAEQRGLEVIIAGAGGAAHLPGMAAAKTILPVLGVPIQSHTLNGIDSLLSIVQMPAGIPVGTLAIGKAGAINAALLATAILAKQHPKLHEALTNFRKQQTQTVLDKPNPRSAT